MTDQKAKEPSARMPATIWSGLGAAIYPGKEAWKNLPGNRYTPEELREMDRNWDIKITPPETSRSVSAD